MVDPGTVLSAIGFTASAAERIINLSLRLRSVDVPCGDLVRELQTFAGVLRYAKIEFRKTLRIYGDQGEVGLEVAASHLSACLDSCNGTISQYQAVLLRIQSASVRRIRWNLLKPELDRLHQLLDMQRSTLNTVLVAISQAGINIEAARVRWPREPATVREPYPVYINTQTPSPLAPPPHNTAFSRSVSPSPPSPPPPYTPPREKPYLSALGIPDQPDHGKEVAVGLAATGGTLTGAVYGAAVGAPAGPLGMAIGGVVGALVSGLGLGLTARATVNTHYCGSDGKYRERP